ncbi:ISL3 family transposase [Microtetraspora fusca]|uniref:ISL3 family transposase n=1 Tax=Microtetraspora fusca TaxID=1997 RepID=A0ABW6VB30_MICFU|nr:ISL3 family transposase [Microtetraspora fusca]
MTVSELLAVLFPHLACLQIDQLYRSGRSVRIQARTRTTQAACPRCGMVSRRVHSSYERRVCDTAVSGQETVLHLRVQRFRCGNDDCGKKTFAEQIAGLTVRYGRHSLPLRHLLQTIGLALGGRAGARLTHCLAAAVNRMTLIRLIRSLPDPEPNGGPQVLGVDDFALRRGHTYGTILIDITTSRPIDVLPERSSDALAAWLSNHPDVQVVCRDRAGCYADGATRGAPQAIQVADRWHMWRNLGDAVERTITKHRAHVRDLPTVTPPTKAHPPAADAVPSLAEPDPAQRRPGRLAERTRQRHALIHQLLAQGRDSRAIARELNLARNTVRRFARASSPEELLVNNGTGKRPRMIEEFACYLRQRWEQGCTNAEQLYQEIKAMGYRGKGNAVREYLRPWRSQTTIALPPPSPPTVRQATGWFLRHPDSLDTDELQHLHALTTACPALAALREHVRAFAHMMLRLTGDGLEQWMNAVQADDLPELHSFVTGLRRDFDAAKAGLTLPHSSGKVEGHVNRIKMLKRQMYGRANPDLLRKRVLLAD